MPHDMPPEPESFGSREPPRRRPPTAVGLMSPRPPRRDPVGPSIGGGRARRRMALGFVGVVTITLGGLLAAASSGPIGFAVGAGVALLGSRVLSRSFRRTWQPEQMLYTRWRKRAA